MENPWLDIASYQIEDEYRFKGRDEDKKKFLKIISKGTFIVLYANSGIGKTSFLNAAIIPYLKRERYMPIRIVFPEKILESKDITKWLYDAIKSFGFTDESTKKSFEWRSTVDTSVTGLDNSLWWLLHTYEIVDKNTGLAWKPLIIFDQFEEIFHKVIGNTNSLKDNLFNIISEISSEALPSNVEEVLDNLDTDVDVDGSHNFKVIFSLRKEYLSDFDYWTNDRYSITELHQNRMFLLPMTRSQAEKVIMEQPVDKENPEEYCKTLKKDKDKILDSIASDNKDEYEPLLLSLLCSKLYEKKKHNEMLNKDDDKDTSPDNLLKDGKDNGIDTILYEFYEDNISKIITNKKHRKAFEAALFDSKGHRNRVKSSLILDDFDALYKDKLQEALLIRVERLYDDNYIELIHDRLALAIYRTQKTKKEHKIKRNKNIIIGVAALLIALLGGFLAFNLKSEKPEVIIVTQTTAGTMVSMHIEEDSTSVTEDDPWTIALNLSWMSDSIMRDTIITRTKQTIKENLPPVFIDKDSPLKLSVAFTDNGFIEYDNSPNSDTIYDFNRLEELGYNIPIIIKREITPIVGRAVFVSGKDTVPIRDERVLLYNNITKTDANGRFSLLVAKNSSDDTAPLIMREGLTNKTLIKSPDESGYTFIFELDADTTAFHARCDTIFKSYRDALHPPVGSKQKPHKYRYTFKKDGKKYVDIYYTKPDKDGHSNALFMVYDNQYKDKYLNYFVGEGQIDKMYDKQGLRNFTFYGKDCVGNKAILRSSVSNGYMYVYLYYSDKEKIFVEKIKGLTDN